MTQTKPNIEIKPTSFSDVVNSEKWGPALKQAAAAGSVAVIEANEQPAPNVAPAPRPKSPSPR